MITDETDAVRPWLVAFSTDARTRLNEFRKKVRDLEAGAEGLLLSHIGKYPGLAIRLATIISYLDWAVGDGSDLKTVEDQHLEALQTHRS